jgi:hypothetical protein
MTERRERRRETRLIGMGPIQVAPIPAEAVLFTHPTSATWILAPLGTLLRCIWLSST